MSIFGANFLQNYQENLELNKGDKVDLQFNMDGYLFLAAKATVEKLYENHRVQLYEKNGQKNLKKKLKINYLILNSQN